MKYTVLLLSGLLASAYGIGEGAQEEPGEEETTRGSSLYRFSLGYEAEEPDGEQVGQKEHDHVETISVTEEVPVVYPVFKKVPYHVRGYFEKAVPYPVEKPEPVPVKVPVKVPYPIHIPKTYPFAVEKKVPYPIHVKVPLHIPVPKPYPVAVGNKVVLPYLPRQPVPYRVLVKDPYPVHVEKEVPAVVKVPYPVKVPVPVHYEEHKDEGFEGVGGGGFGGY